MAKPWKHREISRRLRAEIASGRHAVGSRLPSEPQMVRQYGVSRPTVARALADLQKEGLIERRAGSGTYVTEPALQPASVSARPLALLIPDLDKTEIFQLICGELASLARVHEYSLLWGGSMHPRHETELSLEHAEELCEQFIERCVSGVFFAPYELQPKSEEINRRLAVSLREAGIPVVLLDRDVTRFPNRSDFDLVGLDNVAGGFLLAEHLVKLGCRKLRFVTRPHAAATVEARMAGVREALVRYGLDHDPGWVCVGDPSETRFVRKISAGRTADAFVCANDDTAAALMRSLVAQGFKVPRDVRVVGFDDVKYATLVSPSLTTIHQPCRDLAVIAFRAMMERVADPSLPARSISLPPRLVVRESCGAYLPRVTGGRP